MIDVTRLTNVERSLLTDALRYYRRSLEANATVPWIPLVDPEIAWRSFVTVELLGSLAGR